MADNLTPEQRQAHIDQALKAGIPMDDIQDFLARNPKDENRIIEALIDDGRKEFIEGSTTIRNEGKADHWAYGVPPDQVPPLVSVITTQGASESSNHTPTVGPTGLAYQDDPINYSTMQQSPSFGYTQGGALPSGNYPPIGSNAAPSASASVAAPADNTTTYLMIGAALVVAYLVMQK